MSLITMMKFAIALVLAVLLADTLASPCGDGISPHMVGGDLVNNMDRPYAVKFVLKKDGRFIRSCGGARLSYYYFVTAAECLDHQKYDQMQIIYPAHLLPNYLATKHIKVDWRQFNYDIHPKYDPVTKSHNVAVVWCVDCVKVPDYKKLPFLPRKSERNEDFQSTRAVVAGWAPEDIAGDQKGYNVTSYDTSVINPLWCKMLYFFKWVKEDHLCVFVKGITQADVGTPLIVRDSCEPTIKAVKLIGIASSVKPWWSVTALPTVFTRITPYMVWIAEKMRDRIREE